MAFFAKLPSSLPPSWQGYFNQNVRFRACLAGFSPQSEVRTVDKGTLLGRIHARRGDAAQGVRISAWPAAGTIFGISS
jgi:hypothetical protein